jgi:hypothetical protein
VPLQVTLSASPTNAPLPLAERNALLALYTATNGSTWVANTGWRDNLLGQDPCIGSVWYGEYLHLGSGRGRWKQSERRQQSSRAPKGCAIAASPLAGVTCSAAHIVALNLSGNGLRGTLPVALSDLPYLTTMDVSNNPLKGAACTHPSPLHTPLFACSQIDVSSCDGVSTLFCLPVVAFVRCPRTRMFLWYRARHIALSVGVADGTEHPAGVQHHPRRRGAECPVPLIPHPGCHNNAVRTHVRRGVSQGLGVLLSLCCTCKRMIV